MLETVMDIEEKVAEMSIMTCHWSALFDDNEKQSLERGLVIAGLFSVVFGLWMNLSLLFTNGLDRSYENILNFTIVACIRRMMPFVANVPMFHLKSAIDLDHIRCQFIAFLETFMAVFEVEALTHICIERYVLAKYVTNGWSMQKYHYVLFKGLCLLFASLYSFPPLFGIGRYGFDFTCSICTFDIILPLTWERYFIVAIFILRSIKPASVMLAMLIWARTLEKKLVPSKETQIQTKFTQNVIIITLLNKLCWSPIALIRGCVILSQLINSNAVVQESELNIKWAMWMHWVSPALTTVALLLVDRRIRHSMLHIFTNDTETEENKQK